MTGKTKVWPVKSTISPDIVRWPAVISRPDSVQLFWQDLSKKDAALLKFGRELKELETVQEQLEKKDQELRIEKNNVSFACLFFVVIRYI